MPPRLVLVHDRLFVGLSCREPEHLRAFQAERISHWADHRRTRCDEAILALALDIDYLWNPIKDDGSPKPAAWYRATLDFAREALHTPDGRLAVTCARGQHRGPSMAYLVLRTVYAMSRAESTRALRQTWPPGDPWYQSDIESKLATF